MSGSISERCKSTKGDWHCELDAGHETNGHEEHFNWDESTHGPQYWEEGDTEPTLLADDLAKTIEGAGLTGSVAGTPMPLQQRLQELVGRNAGELSGEDIVKLIQGDQPLADAFAKVLKPIDDRIEIDEDGPFALYDAVINYRRDHPEPEPEHDLLKYFSYEQLPEHLQKVSMPFYNLAHCILAITSPGSQQDKALDKLLESKDAAVRAAL